MMQVGVPREGNFPLCLYKNKCREYLCARLFAKLFDGRYKIENLG